jgi:hypothetical protein
LYYEKEYKFKYLNSNDPCSHNINNCGLDKAQEHGFTCLEPFKEQSETYSSKELFNFFDRRLPDRTRPDFEMLVQEYNLDKDCTPMELLEATGGRLAIDTFELVSPFVMQQSGDFEIEFYVAGWRYYNGEEVIEQLYPGLKLELKLELDNKYDSSAIQVYGPNQTLLGYVPVYYTRYLDEAVKNNKCEAYVDNIGPKDNPQLRLKVKINGTVPLLAEVVKTINMRVKKQKELEAV